MNAYNMQHYLGRKEGKNNLKLTTLHGDRRDYMIFKTLIFTFIYI